VTAGPIVKWAGGKSRLLGELVARVPDRFGRYFEPFAGGAALFFKLAPPSAVLADANADLVTLYRAVASNVETVIERLLTLRNRHCERFYYETRDRWNAERHAWPDEEIAAVFVYLNKTCFNGLWRVNRAGEFNVPVGDYANPRILDPDALRAASNALARAEIVCGDYRDVVVRAQRGDLIYFDPPYDPVGETSNFASYTAGGFDARDQRALAGVFADLVERGCHVLLSNADTPFVRDLYARYRIDRVACSRAINSKGTKRGAVDEVIVVGEDCNPFGDP
jgi:DNA adenine methylase